MKWITVAAAFLFAASPLSAVTSRAQVLRLLSEVGVLDGLVGSGRVSVVSVGESVTGQQIPLVVIRDPDVPVEETRRIFVICRQHGDEPAPTEAMIGLIRKYFASPSADDLRILKRVTFVIVPMMNPDGARRDKRRNANNADLNRDWTLQRQPETRAVIRAIKAWSPSIVIDAHELDRCDGRRDFVEAISSGAPGPVCSYNIELQHLIISKLRSAGLAPRHATSASGSNAKLAHRYLPSRRATPALLLESRQSGRRKYAMEERVRLHTVSVMTAARYLAGEGCRQMIASDIYSVRNRKRGSLATALSAIVDAPD